VLFEKTFLYVYMYKLYHRNVVDIYSLGALLMYTPWEGWGAGVEYHFQEI